MTLFWRIFKIIRIAVYVVLAFIVGAVAVFTLTPPGRENLAGLVSSLASSDQSKVRIGGLSGIWSGPLTLDHVVLEDADGPWLVARGIAVDWSLLPLLSGTFVADRVHADRIEVARLPKSKAAADTTSSGASLPVSLDLRSIELPEIALGEALAGAVAELSASGSLVALAEPLSVRTDLQIQRKDGVTGDLAAKVHFVPSQDLLDVDIRGSEPAGGLLARFLNLPGAPPVAITVSGSGPLSDWKGSARVTVDGQTATSLSGQYRQADGGHQIAVKGDGAFERFLPAQLRPLLAGTATFDIAGSLTGAGGIDIERASIESDSVTGQASGKIDPNGASDLVMELAAKGQDVSLSFGSGPSPTTVVLRSASVRAIGDGREPNLDITADIARVVTSAATLDNVALALHSDAFDVTRRTGPVTGTLTAGAVSLANATAAPLVAGAVKADFAGSIGDTAIAIDRGTVSSDALSGTLNGTVSLTDGSIQLGIEADLLSAALPAAARPALGERTTLSGQFQRGSDGRMVLDPVSVSSGGLAAAGRLALAGDTIDAAITGTIAEVGVLAQSVQGQAAFSLDASGALSAPDVKASITSAQLVAAGQALTDLKLSASGKADLANPAADLSLTAQLGGQALNATTALVTEGEQRQLKGLSVTLGENTLSGDLLLNDRFQPDGTLAFTLADIAPLSQLAGQVAQGNLTGTARFSAGATPQIALDASTTSLTRGDLSVGELSLNAVIDNYLEAPTVSGKVTGTRLTSGSTVVTDIDVALTHAGGWSGFNGGATVAGVPVTVAGRLSLIDGDVVVELANAEAKLQDTKAVLSQPTRIAIADGIVTLDALTLDVAGGKAVVTGTAGSNLDIEARFVAPQDGAPLTVGGEGNPINLTIRSAAVTARGALDALALDIRADLSKVSTKSAQFEAVSIALQSPRFNPSARTGPVSGKVTAGAFIIDDPTIAPLVSGILEADLAGTLSTDALDVTSGTLRSDALNGAFTGRVSLADGSIALDLKADVLSAALPAAARGVLGERTALAASVGRDAAGRFTADDLSVTSDGLSASGKIALDDTSIDATLTGTLNDVARLSPEATGAITFSATATGTRKTPDVTVTVGADRIEAAGQQIVGLKLEATGKADMASPQASVTLSGMVGDQQLKGAATLTTSDGARVVRDLSIALGANTIGGDLTLDENFLPQGTIDFALPDIAPLAALALEDASGDLNGQVTFSTVEDKPQLALTARSSSIRRGDASASDVVIDATVADYLSAPAIAGRVRVADAVSGSNTVKDVDVALTQDGVWTGFDAKATVSGMPAKAAGRVQLSGGKTVIELNSGEATVNGIKIPIGGSGIQITDGQATLDRFSIPLGDGTATISGKAGANLDLDIVLDRVPASLANQFAPNLDAAGLISGTAKVTGSASDPKVAFDLAVKGGQVAQTRAAGLAPIDVTATGTYAKPRLDFRATVGGAAGLDLSAAGSVDLTDMANPRIDVQVRLAQLPASLANGFSPGLGASGTIAGTAKVTGSATNPTVAYTLDWTGARTSQTEAAGFGALTLRSSGSFAGGKLTFDANAGDGTGLTLKGGGTVVTGGTPQLALAFDGTVPLGFLTQRLAAQGLSLTGNAAVSLRVSGAATAPVVEGTIRAGGLRFVDARSGIALNDMTADIALGNGRATITRLSGTLSTGGTISATGTVGIDPGQGFPADLAITIANGRYTDGQVVTTTLTGALTVKGSLVAAPLIAGTITLGRTVITVPEKLPSSLAALDVKRTNAPAAVRAQDRALNPPSTGSSSGGLWLDITINAPQQIFVQGRGLDAELGGSLRLTGPVSAPQATGLFTMKRGRLSILGKRLTFTRGTLGFSGSLVPYLDLAADSTATDATVTVLVTGPANNPKFAFSSVPTLPEDEVLARLVFGRSMSDLSPLQIAQLAEAAAQFAGVGGTTSLLDSLRSKLGVDDLDIKTNDDGSTAVSAGKYLNDRTYLTIEKGDGAGSGKAAIDLDIGRGVKLRGEATDDGEAKGGIFFEREY